MKTHSLEETRRIGARCAREIIKEGSPKKSLVLALRGNLGSGKTSFAQAFLKKLGVRQRITSPTFVLLKKYTLVKPYRYAFHIDCYRIQSKKEFKELGLQEIFKESKNVAVIEWPERIKKILPKHTIWLTFAHGGKENERIIKIQENIKKQKIKKVKKNKKN